MATKGLDAAVRNLHKELEGVKGRSREGLLQAGLFVEAEAVSMAPVQTGTLRGSAFTDATAPGVEPVVVRVGFTAKYAAWVHEMIKRTFIGPREGETTAPVHKAVRPRRAFIGPRLPTAARKKQPPWAPGTGPKFLQRAVMENTREILAVVANYAKRGWGAE